MKKKAPRHENSFLDSPELVRKRRIILSQKRFLRQIYSEWYTIHLTGLPDGLVLELGSGAGFLKEKNPKIITSDILITDGIDLVLDAQHLPFEDEILDVIIMNNVLHHIPNPQFFFEEASRCIRADGIISMNEPWVSWWSKLIYKNFHHEAFDPNAKSWSFESTGPLSSANGAIPWIIFYRDSEKFNEEFPIWNILSIQPHSPFSYLLSGGFTLPSLAPAWSYKFIRSIENIIMRFNNQIGMFAFIILKRS